MMWASPNDVVTAKADTNEKSESEALGFLAGVAGFEPTNEGVKVPCLTAWLYPFNLSAQLVYHIFSLVSI